MSIIVDIAVQIGEGRRTMDWKEALNALILVAPKLAFKPALVEHLKKYAHEPTQQPPSLLFVQLDTMLSVAKQNRRVAQQYGYPTLEEYAKRTEIAIVDVLSAIGTLGLQPARTQQGNDI